MAYDANHAQGKSPGIAQLTAARSRRSIPMGRYAPKCARLQRTGNGKIRGTTRCCIRSKSSRFNIHPFREGNGRTQRGFWHRVARDAGWQLDWRTVHGATNDRASRAASERQDFGPLREMLDQIVSKATPQSERDAARRVAEHARLSFPTSATETVRQPQCGPTSARQARAHRAFRNTR